MFRLDQVVPWGRSFEEYQRMFALRDDELGLRIAGCGDGPAGFNAEATRRGARVVSCDPIYRFSASQIRERIAVTREEVLDQTRCNAGDFVWDGIRSVEELGERRMAAMTEFLNDYDRGRAEGRYLAAALPALPFAHATFDLALCSHLLFLYTAQLGEGFHRSAVREMCRVAAEVRIFPLIALDGRPSPFIERTLDEVGDAGFDATIETVAYEFQRGANRMMRIRAGPSAVSRL
jgi:hypothetical protein